MWYKVQELHEKKLTISRISRETSLDRATVRKYIEISEQEFHDQIKKGRNLPLKLEKYIPFVKEELKNCEDLSCAQIEDHLREHFPDLPDFHSKTVYNFVQMIRKKYDIPKPNISDSRIFEKVPETAYGQQAQVDFGQTIMQTSQGKRQKVYFFVMVLSRSRFKFIYLDNKPFVTSSSIMAHELAFEYFQGVPKEIVYDQDSVFIHDENLGDYLLTDKFRNYCNNQDFKTVFCRKSDPQSKGKVENAVKFVKQNFLRGRKYIDNQILNQEALLWLARTGNGKIHSTTQKIPTQEWSIEKNHLIPIKSKQDKEPVTLPIYKVRKDNTIAYKSNLYSLPAGTYKNKETSVLLESKDNKLNLYTFDKELITTHEISLNRGEYVRNTDHSRDKSKTIPALEENVLKILAQEQISLVFLDLLKKDKPRYYRDNLHYIEKNMKPYPQDVIKQSLTFCIDNKQLNAAVFLQIMEKINLETKMDTDVQIPPETLEKLNNSIEKEADIHVQTSSIETYEKIFTPCTN